MSLIFFKIEADEKNCRRHIFDIPMVIFYRREINVRNFFRPTKRMGKITISGRALESIHENGLSVVFTAY
jgi:hypothetical protein